MAIPDAFGIIPNTSDMVEAKRLTPVSLLLPSTVKPTSEIPTYVGTSDMSALVTCAESADAHQNSSMISTTQKVRMRNSTHTGRVRYHTGHVRYARPVHIEFNLRLVSLRPHMG